MALSRLRLRLAAGFALAFGVALALLSLASLGYLWRESRTRLDARLFRVARGVAEAVHHEALETPDSSMTFVVTQALVEWPIPGDHWLVTDGQGTVLASTDARDRTTRLVDESRGITTRTTVRVGASDLRLAILDTAVTLSGSRVIRYRIAAFGSTSGIEEDTEALAAVFAIAAPLIIILSLMGGYLIAGRALRPVQQLGETIAAIAPGDLSRRIEVNEGWDELTAVSTEFNRLFERLQQAQLRNRQFIQEAAHQIRTPLTLVLGEADLGRLSRNADDETSRQILQRIATAAQQMRRRVDELFLLAEAEASSTFPLEDDVELDGLVMECTDLIRTRAAAANRVLALGSVAHVTVRGNAALLREALLELLENACRYGGESAPVVTEVTGEPGWGILTVSNASGADGVPSSAGRQLGLRIVTWIVDGHGGQLQSADLDGRHRVVVRLPTGPQGLKA